jgi:two-component system, LytTR family, response regulator
MKTRCLIIDDEPLAIKLIEKHLSELTYFEVVATANSAVKALDILKSKEIDLLFCDIKMPMLSGLDLLKTLKNPPKTIITTAHREFALEGYELDIVDYLLKPITFERFFKAIEKYLRTKDNNDLTPPLPIKTTDVLTVKSNNKFYKINLLDLHYIESQKDYAKFYLKDRDITAKYKISDLENELSSKGFLRIHRSFLINQQHIISFSATHIEVGKTEIPIGAGYREAILNTLVTCKSISE